MELQDQAARRRIAEDLGSSLVVVAGAGTGKTASLVGRVLALLRDGAGLGEMAVITFTEAAASELRTRLRQALDDALAADPDDSRLLVARSEVDEAAICTLHAFAQRMLVEHSVAAGLPPGFDVLDEVAEQAELQESLAQFVDELLDDPSAEPMLLRGFVLGLDNRAIAEVAACLHRHWDRLEGDALARIEAARPDAGSWAPADLSPVLDAIDAALELRGLCSQPDDLLFKHLNGRLADARALLLGAADDEHAWLPVLAGLGNLGFSHGQRGNWANRADEVRSACAAAEAARQQVLAEAGRPVAAEVLGRLAAFTLVSAARRASEGRLSFHDLLVHARSLLRHDAEARTALRARYRLLLVDEFQDTDPIQVELAARLAAAAEGSDDLGDCRPGALFVVGDPKQSIYRFRRADIALFEQVCAAVGDEVTLDANFRSVPGILEFVNVVFAELFSAVPDGDQAAHRPLHGARGPLPSSSRGGAGVQLRLAGLGPEDPEGPLLALPPVVVLGGAMDGSVGEIRRAAARHAAAAVARAVEERWPVSRPGDTDPVPRALRFGDVAVLIPTRTSLPPVEEAFEEAGIPYRLEGAALLWGSDDVHDVLCALAAADEPSDAVSVLAALRSPGLGCGDDDLVSWSGAGGSWDPRAPAPEGLEDHAVARAMARLGTLHRRRWWAEPSEMVHAAMEELRSYELAFAHRRPRDHWHRLRWLADQARFFDESSGGTLHDFLQWAELQRQGDGRASVLGPPDVDDDAVRVMTVHGAKGLEFPAVVLMGLEREDASGHRADAVLWDEHDDPQVRAGTTLRSAGYERAAEVDRDLDRLERVRLLYVAMTRARDHLLLCLHHKEHRTRGDTAAASQLAEICRAHPLLWRRLPAPEDEEAESARPRKQRPVAAGGSDVEIDLAALQAAAESWGEELGRWTGERAALVDRLSRPGVVSATALAGAGEDEGDPTAVIAEPVDALGAGTLRASGAGLAIGRAVHSTLAAVDLVTGRDASGREAQDVAGSRATAQGVGEHAAEVAAMVRRALSSDVVRAAAQHRHHKEMYVAMPLPDGVSEPAVLEGFVDLLVEDDDGFVVVDFKTDRLPGGAPAPAALEHYRRQVAAYALCVEAATGKPVVRCVLLFVAADHAIEVVVAGEDLANAKAGALESARSLVAV